MIYRIGKYLVYFAILLSFPINMFANTYYIDASKGNDANNGLSPQKAWKTLGKINRMKFSAGDRILLKGGSFFAGSMVLKSIAGQPEKPILVSSYGKGSATIMSGDSVAFIAIDCQYLIVKNLKVQGSGRLNGNKTSGFDFCQNSNLTIDSVEASGYLFSGLQVRGGNNIKISHSYAHDNGFCGIYVTSDWAKVDSSHYTTINNVYIGYSVAENNPGCPAITDNHSGNGILVGGVSNALIEYCEAMNNGWDMPREGNGPVGIWAYMSDSVVIQHCYAHHNKTSAKGADGGGFDFDGGVTNSVLQYNLSEFNEGAGYGMFQYAGASGWDNNIVRYNISYHDGSKNGQCGIFMWRDRSAVPMTNLHAYNNTIVNKFGYGVNFLPGDYKQFVFENNIFLVTDSTKEFTGGSFTGAMFDRNLYWNSYHAQSGFNQPEIRLDNHALLADPLISLPPDGPLQGYSPKTIHTISYFKLQNHSPASKSGKRIDNNGGKDFWDQPVLQSTNMNIGADGK